MEPQIDEKKIQRLYENNEEARVVLDLMAKRSKAAKITTVDAVQKATGYDRSHVIALFRNLDEAGCGHFLSGRRAYPSRFAWSTNMVSVGKMAARVTKRAEPPVQSAAPQPEPEVSPPIPEVEEMPLPEPTSAPMPLPTLIEHNFALRPDFSVTLKLPPDVKPVEVLRLTDYLQTLPFIN